MNKENMEKLLKHLERTNNPVKFEMERFFGHGGGLYPFEKDEVIEIINNHSCGTTACLAGHAAILAWQEGKCLDINDIKAAAEKWLDINGEDFFFGNWKSLSDSDYTHLSDLTLKEAITEIKYIIKTGKVAEYEY